MAHETYCSNQCFKGNAGWWNYQLPACVTVREKFLRFLFGRRQRLTVIVPGDSVESLSINEVAEEGGKVHEQD